MNFSPAAPPQLVQMVSAVEGLATLLACVDPDRWNTLARPSAESLAALARAVHQGLDDAVAEAYALTAD